MRGYHLSASVSTLTLAHVLRLAQRTATLARGAVLYPDGTPVLTCDLKILRPFRLEPKGEHSELVLL